MAEKTIPLTSPKGSRLRFFQDIGATEAELWDNIRDGVVTNSLASLTAGWQDAGNFDATMWRTYMTFNTANLNGATVSAAKLKLTGIQYWRNIHESSQIGSLPSSDYQAMKTTVDFGELPAQGSGIGNGSAAFTDVEVVLSAAGIASINTDSITDFSFRGTGDTSNRGAVISDSYTYVILSNAELVITYDPILIFSESVSVGDVLGKEQEKVLSESIITLDQVDVDGEIPGRTFFESVNVNDTKIIGRFIEKTLSDAIMAKDVIRKHLNGIIIGKWGKVAKEVTAWGKTVKIPSIWRKTQKK